MSVEFCFACDHLWDTDYYEQCPGCAPPPMPRGQHAWSVDRYEDEDRAEAERTAAMKP